MTDPWAEYRRRRQLSILTFVAIFPAETLAGWIGVSFFDTAAPMLVVAVLWAIALIVAGRRYATWPCPRCGKPFSTSAGHSRGFGVIKCVHCGLVKFSTALH